MLAHSGRRRARSALVVAVASTGCSALGTWRTRPQPTSLLQLDAAETFAHSFVIPEDWHDEIQVITVETRTTDSSYPVPGVPGAKFTNLGAGQEWHGLFTKPKLFKQWLDNHPDPNKVIVFADSADVLFGGCSQEQLMDNYRATVAKSGGVPVVMGAELGLDPPPSGAYTDIHKQFGDRRKKVQEIMALEDASYGDAAVCEIKRSDPKRCYVPSQQKVKEGHWPCAGPCSWPPALTFLNSGFIMGPVWAMREVAAGMIEHEELPVDAPFRDNWHDQGAATLYMAANPNKLTLDYTGSIVLNMHQMKLNESLEIMGGLFINKVTGVPQCFIHANGPSLFKLNRSLIAYASLPPGGSMHLHGW